MNPSVVPISYLLFYTIIPTLSIIGNALIVYITVRSESLRSSCNILIALISASDVLRSFSHYVMIASYEFTEYHQIRHDFCVYLQLIPLFGLLLSSVLLFTVALDRLLSLQKFYSGIIIQWKKLYTAALILPGFIYASFMVVWVLSNQKSQDSGSGDDAAKYYRTYDEEFSFKDDRLHYRNSDGWYGI
ncbi:hypothetical protein DICVIV_10389 [Dictyocaulus viviparus]|uniref:G-protein coupled receptors family 1 profile domain-containing protein n=1 Tax=Dictyocaulus viviparus TaxID=29172 RepID=A0A0D8XFY5_DICVI|nr:hypothetical protein DICVIV_10389 [Dictyocaulus viviparus]